MLFSKFYEITTSSKNARASFIFTYCYFFLLYFGWFAFELNMIKTVYHLSNFHNLGLGKDGTFEL